jgi:hypothetical protein
LMHTYMQNTTKPILTKFSMDDFDCKHWCSGTITQSHIYIWQKVSFVFWHIIFCLPPLLTTWFNFNLAFDGLDCMVNNNSSILNPKKKNIELEDMKTKSKHIL